VIGLRDIVISNDVTTTSALRSE